MYTSHACMQIKHAEISRQAETPETPPSLSLRTHNDPPQLSPLSLDLRTLPETSPGLYLRTPSETSPGLDLRTPSETSPGLDLRTPSETSPGLDLRTPSETSPGLNLRTPSETSLGLDLRTPSEASPLHDPFDIAASGSQNKRQRLSST